MVVKKKLEKDILREIGEYLTERGVFFWRSNNIPVFGQNNGGHFVHRSMPKFSLKGVPDIIIVTKEGKFVALEVKRPGAKLRPEQVAFARRCTANKAMYFVVTSVEDTKDALYGNETV